MLKFLKEEKKLSEISSIEKNFLIACILIEGAKSDDDLGEDEIESIKSILSKKFKLGDTKINKLFSDALKEVNDSVEIYSLTRDIKNNFSHEQILELFEDLWEVIIIDEFIDDFEAALMSKLSGLLAVSSKESQNAKLKILNKLNLTQT